MQEVRGSSPTLGGLRVSQLQASGGISTLQSRASGLQSTTQGNSVRTKKTPPSQKKKKHRMSYHASPATDRPTDRPSVRRSARQSVRPSFRPVVRPSGRVYVRPTVRLSVRPHVPSCMSARSHVRLVCCRSIGPSARPSVCLSVCPLRGATDRLSGRVKRKKE